MADRHSRESGNPVGLSVTIFEQVKSIWATGFRLKACPVLDMGAGITEWECKSERGVPETQNATLP